MICAIVNDNPEGQLLSLVYNSAMSKYPCRTCWYALFQNGSDLQLTCITILFRIKGENMSDPDAAKRAPLRTTKLDRDLRSTMTKNSEFKDLSSKKIIAFVLFTIIDVFC